MIDFFWHWEYTIGILLIENGMVLGGFGFFGVMPWVCHGRLAGEQNQLMGEGGRDTASAAIRPQGTEKQL